MVDVLGTIKVFCMVRGGGAEIDDNDRQGESRVGERGVAPSGLGLWSGEQVTAR